MIVHQESAAATPGTLFQQNLVRFSAGNRTRWWRAATDLPDLGPEVPWYRRRRNERRTDRFVADLEDQISARPRGEAERRVWSTGLRRKLRRFGSRLLALDEAEQQVIFSDEYFEATARFAREAHAFDPSLEIHDLSQALRNVWIMHLLQLLLDRQLRYTPAILAYSLLYPYTDNYLDAPRMSPDAKERFCRRLERRLAGGRLLGGDLHERSVFRLIRRIEETFPRPRFPNVYSSLLAIHHAQTRSLRQQGRRPGEARICEAGVVDLSIAKGGSSVLADGYLVAGDLSRREAEFFFSYGVFLQLADDLQDLEEDLAAGHMTVFSSAAGVRPLDRLANRLVHFLDGVLASERFSADRFRVLKSVIRRNCVQLVVQAAGQHPELFSRRYLRTLERHSPTRFSYARKKRGRLLACYRQLNERLSREGRAVSIFEAVALDGPGDPG